MNQPKRPRPPVLSALIALGEHADGNSAFVLHDGLELPRLRAHESMRWSLGDGTLARNHGKQIGIPRGWLDLLQRDFELRKSTSSAPAGFQRSLGAEQIYLALSQGGGHRTRGIAPLPSHTLATPGIPNRR